MLLCCLNVQGPLQEVDQLQQSLVDHKVSPHEPIEKLGSGLYKHMEQASDGEWCAAAPGTGLYVGIWMLFEMAKFAAGQRHSRCSRESLDSCELVPPSKHMVQPGKNTTERVL